MSFRFSRTSSKQLESLAKANNKTKTAVLEELIADSYRASLTDDSEVKGNGPMKFKLGDKVTEVFTNKVGEVMEIKPERSLPYLVVFEDHGKKDFDFFKENQLVIVV